MAASPSSSPSPSPSPAAGASPASPGAVVQSPSRRGLSLHLHAWSTALANWPTTVDAIHFPLRDVLLAGGLLGALLVAVGPTTGSLWLGAFVLLVLTCIAIRYTPEYQWYLVRTSLRSGAFTHGASLVGTFLAQICDADSTLVDELATTLPDTLQPGFFEHVNLRYCRASFPMIDALRDIQECARVSVDCRLRLETIRDSAKSSASYQSDARDKLESVLSVAHFLRLLRCTHWIREHPAYVSTVAAAATVSASQAAQRSAKANQSQAEAQQSIATAQWIKLAARR